MFNDFIEEKITRAVKNWEETNTGDFNDSSFLSYILILKLLKQVDVTSPADSANINAKLDVINTDVNNGIKSLDANIRSSLSTLHNDLVSVEGKLDNIATWLSKVNTNIASSNTLLTQIEANTK